MRREQQVADDARKVLLALDRHASAEGWTLDELAELANLSHARTSAAVQNLERSRDVVGVWEHPDAPAGLQGARRYGLAK